MSPRIQILYEDKLSPSNPKNFGPHVWSSPVSPNGSDATARCSPRM